jgi:hypothetical protein
MFQGKKRTPEENRRKDASQSQNGGDNSKE